MPTLSTAPGKAGMPQRIAPPSNAGPAGQDAAINETLTAIYPATEGVQQGRLRNLTDQVLQRMQKSPPEELLPLDIRDKLSLPKLDEAIRYERNVSKLYFEFHEAFAEDSDLWWHLSAQEEIHASLLESFKSFGLFRAGTPLFVFQRTVDQYHRPSCSRQNPVKDSKQ